MALPAWQCGRLLVVVVVVIALTLVLKCFVRRGFWQCWHSHCARLVEFVVAVVVFVVGIVAAVVLEFRLRITAGALAGRRLRHMNGSRRRRSSYRR